MSGFVPVYLDGDSEAAQIWGERLKAAGYPTILVLKLSWYVYIKWSDNTKEHVKKAGKYFCEIFVLPKHLWIATGSESDQQSIYIEGIFRVNVSIFASSELERALHNVT